MHGAPNARSGQAEPSTEYPVPLRRRFVYSRTIDTVIVRIETDTGHVGWGEAKAPVAPQATAKIIELLLTDILIGADPRDVLVLWERMYAGMRVRGHRAGFYIEAIAGVDIALWDLAGQAADAPISTLLGGKMRESVRVYASGIPSLPLDAPDEAIAELVEEARSLRAAGYTGVKMAIGRGVQGDLRAIRAIRDGLGDDFTVYADAAGVYSRADAMRLGEAMEELRRRLLRDADPARRCRGVCRAGAEARDPDRARFHHDSARDRRADPQSRDRYRATRCLSRRRHHRMPAHRRARRLLRARFPAARQHRLGGARCRQCAPRCRDAEQHRLRVLDRQEPDRRAPSRQRRRRCATVICSHRAAQASASVLMLRHCFATRRSDMYPADRGTGMKAARDLICLALLFGGVAAGVHALSRRPRPISSARRRMAR